MPAHSTQSPPFLAHLMVERRAKTTMPLYSPTSQRAGVLCGEQSLPQPRERGQECEWSVGVWVGCVKALPALPVCVSPKLGDPSQGRAHPVPLLLPILLEEEEGSCPAEGFQNLWWGVKMLPAVLRHYSWLCPLLPPAVLRCYFWLCFVHSSSSWLCTSENSFAEKSSEGPCPHLYPEPD